MDAAIAGVVAGGALIQERRAFARQRYEIIAANAELQERELIKMASLSLALADTLRRRGVADPAASLAAEVAITVFRVGFERWVADPVRLDLPQLIHAVIRGAQGGDGEQRGGKTLPDHDAVTPTEGDGATSGDEQYPTERLTALNVGVRPGGVGERERPIDDHFQFTAPDGVEMAGDHGVRS